MNFVYFLNFLFEKDTIFQFFPQRQLMCTLLFISLSYKNCTIIALCVYYAIRVELSFKKAGDFSLIVKPVVKVNKNSI